MREGKDGGLAFASPDIRGEYVSPVLSPPLSLSISVVKNDGEKGVKRGGCGYEGAC